MAFDLVTLLTVSVLVLFAVGALMVHAGRGARGCRALIWSGTAFMCLGLGFVMLLTAPTDIRAPVRVFGNGMLMLPYGLLWAAARVFNGRRAPFEPVVAGALAWLAAASLFDPSQAWRMAVTSGIVTAYSAAIALEHRAGDAAAVPSQRWASRIFAAHGAFFLLRTVLGPTFGLAPWGPNVAALWGALLGLETVLVAVTLGVVSIAMDRERTASLHRRDALEDALTGIGNRRALFGSGRALLEAAEAAGRPAALLLMDLDHFKAVNDTHGHPAGDRLLVAFARLAHDYLPPTSLVCRVGGEEFAAVLPGADAARALAVADEIRALFAHLAVAGPGGPVRTTVSIGIAVMGDEAADEGDGRLAALLARADRCLYAAKHAGRDRVVAEGDPARPRTAA